MAKQSLEKRRCRNTLLLARDVQTVHFGITHTNKYVFTAGHNEVVF